jgi:cytochrome P450
MSANTKIETSSILSTADKDPFEFFEAQRALHPVVHDEKMGGWVVYDYEDCKHVLESEHLYRHPYADLDEVGIEIKGGKRNITILQGEEHTLMHRYLSRLFMRQAIEDYMVGHVRPIMDYLFDRIARQGEAELCYEFASQLPPRVFISLFGLDWKDEELVDRELQLHTWIMDWVGGKRDAEHVARARAASKELNEMLLPIIRKRKEERGDDFISRLWNEAPGILDDITELDVLALCREIFLAGSDTTVFGIANAFHVLLTQPEVRKKVEQDRGTALTNFVEETLRLFAVVQYRFRVANQDGELHGQQIKKNELLIIVLATANRDPAKFKCPADVDLARPEPFRHLAFNWGPRTCAGAPLARAELKEVIDSFLDRLPNVRLDEDKPPPAYEGFYLRWFRPLHVVFDKT